jgi:hypothetical protein
MEEDGLNGAFPRSLHRVPGDDTPRLSLPVREVLIVVNDDVVVPPVAFANNSS